MKYSRLGDLLVATGAISEDQLQQALKMQKQTKKRLGAALIEGGFISESQLIEALQLQLGVEFVDLASTTIPPEMANVLSRNIARKHNVVPVKIMRDDLYLAMSDPLNFTAIEEVKAATGKHIIPLISTQAATERAIANLYGGVGAVKAIEEMSSEVASSDMHAAPGLTIQLGDDDANSAPTIRLVNSIIDLAVTENASDIHIEPREKEVVVRMRIDGVLQQILTIPKDLQNSVLSRVKIMGGMDIAERRAPQDGRANARIRQKDVDMRISSLPTIYGEKIVIRMLTKSTKLLSLEGIGLRGENKERFSNLIHHNSNGVILIVGPTGSGKSATMNTMVRDLYSDAVNLVTLEDPVEYNLTGVNQVQINEKAGLTFASGLRSILRQDPDIIGVGEIRDGETAEIALRAAMTGHLVLTTVHTNNAVSSIDRLLDLGLEPYLIATSVKGIVSQRLVRCLCPRCRVAYKPDEDELRMLHLQPGDIGDASFYRGEGCSDCFQTGYRGRTGMFEVLTFTSAMKQVIADKGTHAELDAAIARSGFVPMLQNGRELVLRGITSVEEVSKNLNTTEE